MGNWALNDEPLLYGSLFLIVTRRVVDWSDLTQLLTHLTHFRCAFKHS